MQTKWSDEWQICDKCRDEMIEIDEMDKKMRIAKKKFTLFITSPR